MKLTKALVLAGATACCLIAGFATATPTVGAFYNNILSAGLANNDIHANAFVQLADEDFTAEVHTDGASNVVVQEVKFSPGGTTCVFRANVPTDSGRTCPAIPVDRAHRFRTNVPSDSGLIVPTFR